MKVGIIGAGPGGIYAAYELVKSKQCFDITIIEKGHSLEKRICPMHNGLDHCANCKSCSIMEGFGGAGAFSDGKFNITNDFGGTLFEKIGKEESTKLMEYVDEENCEILNKLEIPVGELFESGDSLFHRICLQNKLTLLDANIRHLGTDKNYKILEYIYKYLVEHGVHFQFDTEVENIYCSNDRVTLETSKCNEIFEKVIIAVGRSGSKWMSNICKSLKVPTESNRVDLGVRVELPYDVFSNLTDKLYESKIVYRTQGYEDNVRTFCMNPKGIVVNENTNGIITVNGHSFEDESKHTNNTNFALLVSQHFTEPFNDSNGYGESIAKLSNMLGKGVIVQRFGDLIRCKRTTNARLEKSTVRPTLAANPGDLSLVLPKRILDDIIEMIYALNKIAPGTANDDTLLYGIEVKFYNMQVSVDNDLKICDNIYVIGDGSGITHSLSQAAASGVYVAGKLIG